MQAAQQLRMCVMYDVWKWRALLPDQFGMSALSVQEVFGPNYRQITAAD